MCKVVSGKKRRYRYVLSGTARKGSKRLKGFEYFGSDH